MSVSTKSDLEFPLSWAKKLQLFRKNEYYQKAFLKDLTSLFFKEIRDRIARGRNYIIEIVGETGSGKSWGGFGIGAFGNKLMQKPLTVKNIVFPNWEFNERVKLFKKRNTIIKDEQQRRNVGEGSAVEMLQAQDIEEIVRKAQLNFIFVSPESRAWHTGVHFILQTFLLNYEDKTNIFLIHPPNDYMLMRPYGHIKLKHPIEYGYREHMKKLVVDYEIKKDEFINQAIEQTSSAGRYIKMQEVAKTLSENLDYMQLKSIDKRKAYLIKTDAEMVARFSKSQLDTIIQMTLID